MININTQGEVLTLKGLGSITLFDTTTDKIIVSSPYFDMGSISVTGNSGDVEGGVGNGLLNRIPDSTRLTVSMSTKIFSMALTELSLGAKSHYNGIADVADVVTVKNVSGKLSITALNTPVMQRGSTSGNIVGYVDGKVFKFGVGADSKKIEIPADSGFIDGQEVCLRYFVKDPMSQEMAVDALVIPSTVRAAITGLIFSNRGGQVEYGNRRGEVNIVIPLLQFNNETTINISQTEAAQTDLNGVSLSHAEENPTGCSGSGLKIAYISQKLYGDELSDVVSAISVAGELIMTSGAANKLPIPVKGLYKDGTYDNIDPTMLTFTIKDTPTPPTGLAISEDGVLSGATDVGTAVVEIVAKDNPNLKTSTEVEVIAPA